MGIISSLVLLTYVVPGTEPPWGELKPRCFAWPEPGRATKAKVRIALDESTAKAGRASLRVDYEFPDELCRQVVVDFPLRAGRCYGRIEFWLKGDKSGNRVVVWLGAAGGWFGQGAIRLDFEGWRHFALDVRQTDTDVAHTLRFCIVQEGGLGRHSIFLDGIALTGAAAPRLKDLHVFGRGVPQSVKALSGRPRAFEVRLTKNADRTVLLLDGEPLFCVLDVAFDPAYLEAARRAGVNCFAIDLYWREVEPRPGYREWPRLREKLEELGRLGFAAIILIGPHQPIWWGLRHRNLPGALHGRAYALSPEVVRDFGRIVKELVLQTRDLPNVVGYMVSAGGEQDSCFPEVLGERRPSIWRKDSSCLRHFREWLKQKYGTVEALRRAWGDEKVDFETATPPERLGRNDFRRRWLDWAEFANSWWVRYMGWVASIVRPLAPRKLLVARFGWPVFQAENLFLARVSEADLLQCKDGVASWEVGHPGKQMSRTALYYGALRHSAKVVFPEMDIIHDRGYHEGDISRYVPLFAKFAGALWYYRGIKHQNPAFVEDLRRAVEEGKRLVRQDLGPAKVGLFYSVAFANWISVHRNYANESALVGAAELFDDMGLRFAAVSEFTLPDLFDFNLVAIPYNPAISREAEEALRAYLELGGAVVMEMEAGEFYLSGERRPKGTLDFAPVRAMAVKGAHGLIAFELHGLGLSGERLTIGPGVREWVQPDPDAEIVGVYKDSAIALKGRVLYIPCRFFAPYSYDRGTDKAAMRKLISAFLSRVRDEQRERAREAVREAGKAGGGKVLLAWAKQALREGLFVKAIYLAKLSMAVATKGASPKCRLGAATLLAEQEAGWLKASVERVRKLSQRTEVEAGRVLQEAEEALQAFERARKGGVAPEYALALCTVAYERLVEFERGLRGT